MRSIFRIFSWTDSERGHSVFLDEDRLVVEVRSREGSDTFCFPFQNPLLQFLVVYLRKSVHTPKDCVVDSLLKLKEYFSQHEEPFLKFDLELDALFALHERRLQAFWISLPFDDFDIVGLNFDFEIESLRAVDGSVAFAKRVTKERRAARLNFSASDFLTVFSESGPLLLASTSLSKGSFSLCLEGWRGFSHFEVRVRSCISGLLPSLEKSKFSLDLNTKRPDVVERALFEFGKKILELSDSKKGLVLPRQAERAFEEAYAAAAAKAVCEGRVHHRKRPL